MSTEEEFQIRKSTSFSLRLELEALIYELGSRKGLADFCKGVTSKKGESSSLIIHRPLSIATVKQKIRDDIGFSVSRLLLHDHPLQDETFVGETKLTPGVCLRTAKGKQNLKSRRVNHKPGPKQRRQTKLNQLAEADRALLLEHIVDNEQIVRELDESSGPSEPGSGSSVPEPGSSDACLGSSVPESGTSEPCLEPSVSEPGPSEPCLEPSVSEPGPSEPCLEPSVSEPGPSEPCLESSVPEPGSSKSVFGLSKSGPV